MPLRHFVAFDFGAESGRAIVGTLDQGKLLLEEKHRFLQPNGRLRGHLHWNVLTQWEQIKTGLRNIAQHAPNHRIELAGIGVDTWGVDYGLLDADGNLLGFPFCYRDSRTDGMMDKVFARVPRNEVFASTGIQFMQLNTLFQVAAACDQQPRLIDAAQTLLFMPDLFNYLFTGQRKGEFSIASTSQMYDMGKNDWAYGMLERLGIPTRILPQVVPSGTIIGPLLKSVADECGVDPAPVIAPGCHDTASAVAAVPAEGSDWCYISSGTWSLMGVEIDKPIINEASLRYNYTNEGGVAGKVRFLKNIMGMWLVQECRRHWQKQGHDHSYAELSQMAQEAKGLSALINPDHGPFLSPGDMPVKIEQFCKQTNQKAPQTQGEFVRCCLDSLALTYRRALEGLEDMLGRKIAVIHIVGGGCQNTLLNQMTADACGKPVVAGPVEATAMGNILVQAMATGDVKSLSDLRAIVRASSEVKRYEPRDTGKWDSAYARYREILK